VPVGDYSSASLSNIGIGLGAVDVWLLFHIRAGVH